MTPSSIVTKKIERDNWEFFQVDGNEFWYLIEPPGIQMLFSDNFPYSAARKIADEIINNIIGTGQSAELTVIYNTNLYI